MGDAHSACDPTELIANLAEALKHDLKWPLAELEDNILAFACAGVVKLKQL